MTLRGVYPFLRRPARFVAGMLFDKQTVSALKSRFLPADFTYDSAYFRNDIDGPASQSAATIAESIMRDLAPRTVIDVGCGTGALISQLRDAGCTVCGLEFASAALEICNQRRLNVRPFDIVRDEWEHTPVYDLAVSMEVAEHVPPRAASRYIDLLTRLSATIVFTGARPGQGGTDHVNEQPHDYWIEKFARRNRVLDTALTATWRESWRQSGEVQSWYYDNLMVFRLAPTVFCVKDTRNEQTEFSPKAPRASAV